MTREGHVRICEGLGGKFPRSTRRASSPPAAGEWYLFVLPRLRKLMILFRYMQ